MAPRSFVGGMKGGLKVGFCGKMFLILSGSYPKTSRASVVTNHANYEKREEKQHRHLDRTR